MILLVNSNESENKLDYVLKHMGSEEYLAYRERDGLTIDEAYQYLKRSGNGWQVVLNQPLQQLLSGFVTE